MNYLRVRAGIVMVSVVGLAIVAFLVSDAVRFGSAFWSDSRTEVGEVSGESIQIKDFSVRVEQSSEALKNEMRQNTIPPSMMGYVVNNAWEQTTSEIILNKEFSKLGIDVEEEELFDMIQGKNPSEQILKYFTNPETGEFERTKLIQFLKSIDQDPSGKSKAQWMELEKSLIQGQKAKKYADLIEQGMFVSELEAKDNFAKNQKIATIKYINFDYASIPDQSIKLEDSDYKDYYETHKNKFKTKEESREIEYVVFDASPTSADTMALKQQILSLKGQMQTTKNDSLFVGLNAETRNALRYYAKGKNDPNIESEIFDKPKGTVIGPIISKGAFKIAKMVDFKNSPDSVKARHILIDPRNVGGVENAKKQADSLKALLKTGLSFEETAKKFSADPGSKDKGGDLGTFARGMMVEAFEDACFNGKVGEYIVVNSSFGVHIIHIQNQKGNSKVVKIAVVDKMIVASAQTQKNAYNTGLSFLSELTDVEKFTEKAKESKLILQKASIQPSQSYLNSIKDARELIRWAFKVDKDEITTDIMELGDKYVIAKLTDIIPQGHIPLDKVKTQIYVDVLNEVKAKKALQDINTITSGGAANLEQLAQKLGRTIQTAEGIGLNNPVLAGIGREEALISSVIFSKEHMMSKPIKGNRGVYIFRLEGKKESEMLYNILQEKQTMMQQRSYGVVNQSLEALKSLSNIKDNRIKFY